MPKVYDEHGWQILIWLPPREHGPPHCHVFKNGQKMKVSLQSLEVIEATRGWKTTDYRAAVRLVEDQITHLRQQWEAIHG